MPNLALLPLVAVALAVGSPAPLSPRQNLKSAVENGHRSVFSVEVTYEDGAKAKETMASMSYGGTGFVLIGKDPHGGEHQLWLDTIADIDVIAPKTIRLAFKDGRKMDLAGEGGFAINTASPDGGSAEVPFEKIKHIRFLHPVRHDGLGNAIFDAWLFSPYTGKRVP